jgi:hypothetical protein
MEPVTRIQPSEAILKQAINQKGENLFDLSGKTPVLIIFLRHFG